MEEKKQRRNKRILIISAMLVLLIALLCFGGTTFAKYITSKSAEAKQVTVAKWGFVVNSNGNLFSEQYSKGSVVASDATGIDVKASALTVAPGTSGSMEFSITGKAEVLAQVFVEASGTDISIAHPEFGTSGDAGYLAAGTYNPLKWTLSKKGDDDSFTAGTGVKDVTLATFITELKKLETGTPIAIDTTINETYKISWKWDFHTDDAHDEIDTVLASVSNDSTFTLPTGYSNAKTVATFNLKVGVKQVQAA